jgi:hypothetical protein
VAELADVVRPDQLSSTAGTGSCQSSVSAGTGSGAPDRAHVTVRELEPRAGERVGEIVRVSRKRL